MRIIFDSKVVRGFPVTVSALIEGFDSGDYGQSGASRSNRKVIEEVEIFKIGTHKSVDFIEKQMTESDWDDLNQEIWDEYHNQYDG